MAFNKKKSRLINVAEHQYRWICSFGSGSTDVTMQGASGVGQKCIVQIDLDSTAFKQLPENQYPTIGPREVARLIDEALQKGWEPSLDKGEIRFNWWDGAGLQAVVV